MASLNPGWTDFDALLHLKDFLASVPGWLSRRYEGPRHFRHVFEVLKKHPHLSRQSFGDEIKTLPLNYLLAANAPLEMIQDVYQMHPDALSTTDNWGYLPLHDSVLYSCSHDVVEFLVDRFPQAAAVKHDNRQYPLTILIRMLALNVFMGKDICQTFQLLYDAHPPGLWADSVEWRFQLAKIIISPNTPPSLLVWLAKKTQGAKRCRISLREGNESDIPTIMRNLRVLVPNLECEHLALSCATLDGTFLAQLFSQVEFDCKMRVQLGFSTGSLPPSFEDRIKSWNACQLGSLSFLDLSMSADDFNCLIKSLHHLPNLNRLVLAKESGTHICCTASLAELLGTGRNLKWLFVYGPALEIKEKEFCQALQNSHSTTLVDYYTDENEENPNPEIAYHSALNCLGRAKITSSTATPEVLVECLRSACSVGSSMEASVTFGLLRESPNLWAPLGHRPGSKKRSVPAVAESGEMQKKQKVDK